jgi:hypothetical protein
MFSSQADPTSNFEGRYVSMILRVVKGVEIAEQCDVSPQLLFQDIRLARISIKES